MPPKPIPAELVALRQRNTLALWVRWRLRELAAGRSGEDRDFAARIEIAGSQWSRIKSGTPIGPKLARRIESACGQPEGWLDQPQEGQTEPGSAAALPLPDSWAASPQALADALGLGVDELAHGIGLAESPTRAGFPSPAADHRVQRIDLNAELVQHEEATMLVRVRGDSMRDVGILDGNLLVVDKSLSAQHGDIVVAVLDGDFTCKQLHWKEGVIKLLPANPDFPEIVPQEGQELRIWGVVTATVRQFR